MVSDASLLRTGHHFGGVSRRFVHDGRLVEAARFMGNGPEIAAWAGGQITAAGWGLSGTLMLLVDDTAAEIEMGDWVVKDETLLVVVPQELFANGYRQVG
jgi:hypothetical protein